MHKIIDNLFSKWINWLALSDEYGMETTKNRKGFFVVGLAFCAENMRIETRNEKKKNLLFKIVSRKVLKLNDTLIHFSVKFLLKKLKIPEEY